MVQQPLGTVAAADAPPHWLSGQIDLGFRRFPTYRSLPDRCSRLLVTLLWLGLERTHFGAQIRAAVDNRRMAQSIGIDTRRLFTLTFALGTGLAGLGGGLGRRLLAINPGYAMENLVYFLMVVAVGGLGSIRGPFVAALLLGIGDTRVQIPGAATRRVLHLSADDGAAAVAAERACSAGRERHAAGAGSCRRRRGVRPPPSLPPARAVAMGAGARWSSRCSRPICRWAARS